MVFVTRSSPGFVAKIEETENQFRAEPSRNSLDTFDYYPCRTFVLFRLFAVICYIEYILRRFRIDKINDQADIISRLNTNFL